MFTKNGIRDLHGWTHESLDILLGHVASVPEERLREPLAGFGIATVWKQLLHILEVEEGWVCDLQDQAVPLWREEDCGTLEELRANKERVGKATRGYLDGLSETELNQRTTKRPLKSPAFILLHVLTHTFHHKGQVVAMLRTLGYPAPDTDLQRSSG
jgi:uncharacterized damage-inducible protein DinB